MKILECIDSLDPALGGTVESTRQRCLGVRALGHIVEVVTLDPPAGGVDRGLADAGSLRRTSLPGLRPGASSVAEISSLPIRHSGGKRHLGFP